MNKIFEEGDLVFVHKESFFFKCISWWTRNYYNHVGIIVGYVGDEPLVLQANWRGIDIDCLKWIEKENEEYEIRRLDLTDKQRTKIIREGNSYIGHDYDFVGLLNFLIGSAKLKDVKEVYCSELVYRILINQNIIKKSVDADMISPGRLYSLVFNISRQIVKRRKRDEK